MNKTRSSGTLICEFIVAFDFSRCFSFGIAEERECTVAVPLGMPRALACSSFAVTTEFRDVARDDSNNNGQI